MLRSYLQLHVVCNYSYAANEKFSCGSHLQLIFSHKLKLQNGVFLIVQLCDATWQSKFNQIRLGELTYATYPKLNHLD
jgi:hypothetical protein